MDRKVGNLLSITPKIVIKGIDVVIKRDLSRHKGMLERSKLDLQSFRQSRSHEIKKKKHYRKLIEEGKYNKKAMERSIVEISINIRHMSDKCKLSQDAIEHHTMIVDNLATQLEQYNKDIVELSNLKVK